VWILVAAVKFNLFQLTEDVGEKTALYCVNIAGSRLLENDDSMGVVVCCTCENCSYDNLCFGWLIGEMYVVC